MNTCINEFRKNVLSQKNQIGCWSSLGSPITTEILGYAGFDWLLLDGEHACNDIMTFIPQLMALKDSRSAPVVRPEWNDVIAIKRLLDIGFSNFLIPFIDTEADAVKAVTATRYPPQGIRGISLAQRNNKYGTVPDYFAKINDNICIMAQIESQTGIDNAEKIAAVDGIDVLFVGPSDLSANLGYFSDLHHPEMQKAIQHVFDVAKAHHKAAGILAPVEADAQRYLAMGATCVAVGGDLGLFRAATKKLADGFITKES